MSQEGRLVTLSSESNHPPSPSSALDLSRELNFSRGGSINYINILRKFATIQHDGENAAGLIKPEHGDGRLI